MVSVDGTPSGEWKFECAIPLKPNLSLQEELWKFQDLPEIDDPDAKKLIAELFPGTTYDLKFLAAAVGFAAAFLECEAESIQGMSAANWGGLFGALVSIILNDSFLFVQALEWKQKGCPDISESDGHPELRDACIIIFEAVG